MFGENTDADNDEENLFLKITEAIFVGWFTLEYLIRFVVSAHKVQNVVFNQFGLGYIEHILD